MTNLEEQSRIAGLPCTVHGCTELRVKGRQGKHSRFCADHDAEARAKRDLDHYERLLTDCTLAHLWRRWETHPDSKAGFVGGRRVYGLTPVGDEAFRVLLEGAEASAVMRADTPVELRFVHGDAVLRGTPL